MKPSTVEVLTWVFIYGGLIVFVLGIFVSREAEGLGHGFMLGGAIVALIGVGLIWLRSRMDNPKKERDE
jgi:hypothetical protein